MFNSQLKQEIKALKEELHHIKQINSSLDNEMLYCRLTPSGKIDAVNDNFCTELHYASQDIVGRNFFDFIPGVATSSTHYKKLCDALKFGQHYTGVVQFEKGDGVEGWLRAVVQPVQSLEGKLLYFTFHCDDLTRTISQSREHENLVEALQRSTAVIEFNPDGTIITANAPFLQGMGYQLEHIQGKHHRMFCDSEEANSAEYEQFWQQLRNGNFKAGRFKRIGAAGQVVWLEASYNPVTDSYGRLYKVVKFATVITEQVEREIAISNAAEIAYTTSAATDTVAIQGSEVINNLVSVMNELSANMIEANTGIGELDEQSQQIATIISSISSIAEQTNLLALNAAIEAARAGDQGRGFAVVADEVRQLASRTTAATEEIVSVVQKNQALTADAVAIVNQGKTKADRGLELADEAGSVIIEIQKGAKEVVGAVGQFTQQLNQ